jgi:uncharacterized protein YbcI
VVAARGTRDRIGPTVADPGTDLTGEDLAAVSTVVVGILSECYGRGPTKAKSYGVDNYVLTVLEDFLTEAESTLLNRGRSALVRDMRVGFQEAIADRFRREVGEAIHREVVAYHSQVTFDPPLAFEIFVLAPPAEDATEGTAARPPSP